MSDEKKKIESIERELKALTQKIEIISIILGICIVFVISSPILGIIGLSITVIWSIHITIVIIGIVMLILYAVANVISKNQS